jgi:hypothetical protein
VPGVGNLYPGQPGQPGQNASSYAPPLGYVVVGTGGLGGDAAPQIYQATITLSASSGTIV